MTGMDTKTALLDCAEDLVRTRGFDGFSYADLAISVGIRKASIHHHFPAKADLGLALIERYSANFFARLDEITANFATSGLQLKAYVAVCRAAIADGNRLCLSVALCSGRESLSPAILNRIDQFHLVVTAWLASLFAQALIDGSLSSVGDCRDEAHACLAQMEGAQLMARAAGDATRFDMAVAGLLGRVN